MSHSDPIADLLTRIRNSVAARKETCCIPASRVKEGILQILKERGYIRNFVREADGDFSQLVVFNKYIGKNNRPVLNHIKRISKPGCRVYKGYEDTRSVMGGLGFTILTTPRGILADEDARKQKVGGEVLCEVW